jgi:hypothetical protein
MATYRIESPDGKVFEVEAPDDATEDQVLARAQAGANSYAQSDRASAALNSRSDVQRTRERFNVPPGYNVGVMAEENPDLVRVDPATGRKQVDYSKVNLDVEPTEQKALGPWASSFVRPLAKGVAALPLMAMDAGVAARNLVTGENYEHPSTMFNRALDSYTTPAAKGAGKVAEDISSMLVGGAIPGPQAASQLSAGFVRPAANATQQVLRQGRQAGYVAPPSTTPNPSPLARTLEGISGKAATAQAASTRNQEVTNRLARRAVGLADDAPLTRESLSAVRAQAGKVYEQVADSGEIVPDSKFLEELIAMGRGADDIAKDFPGANVAASKEIQQLTESLLRDKFSARSAIEYLKELRKSASSNTTGLASADPAKRALGYAQREAAGTLEGLIARHLESIGKGSLAQRFNEARTLIAKSHDVESALNEATGNVVAHTVGQLAKKGKPLSGDLETIALFSRAFPKATQEVNQSFLGLSPLDWTAGGLGSVATGSPLPALIPAARVASRSALMSGPMQRQAAGLPGRGVPPSAVMAAAPVMSFDFGDAQMERQKRIAELLRGEQ